MTRIQLFMAAFVCALGACVGPKPGPAVDPTRGNDARARLQRLFRPALAWYDATEAELLPAGRTLSEDEMAHARELGVLAPERVRVVVLESFPLPPDDELRAEAERIGLGGATELGRAMGYAVLVKPDWSTSRTVLAHELVHVAQLERLGREPFLSQLFLEYLTVGYAHSSLEREAREKQYAPGTNP